MATLQTKHKRFVVKRLAVFDRPSQVRDALKDRHGVEASLAQLAHYDPTNTNGQSLASDLKTLFWETREAFINMETGAATRYKARRLRELERIVERLKTKADDMAEIDNHLGEMEALAEIRDTLEQVAKETGEKYTAPALLRRDGQNRNTEVDTILERMDAMREEAPEYEPPEMDDSQ